MLTWNVYIENFNLRKIEPYNVFRHSGFCNSVRMAAKKCSEDREAFINELRHELMYYFWSKCEWELILTSWPPAERFNDEKVSVYDQVWLNWDRFCDYVWENRKELSK